MGHGLSKQTTFREAYRSATIEMERKHVHAVEEVRVFLTEIGTAVSARSDDMNITDERTVGELSNSRDQYAHDVQSSVHVIREGIETNNAERQDQHDDMISMDVS